MTAVLAAAAVLGLVTTASGWFVRQSGRARWSAAFLVLGGVALLVGCAAVGLDLDAAASPAFRLAGCLLLPLAVLAYPRLAWREPVSFVLLVVVVGAGVLAVAWERALEPMGYVLVVALLLHAWWAFEQGDADDRRALAWSSLAWIGGGLARSGRRLRERVGGCRRLPRPGRRLHRAAWSSDRWRWSSGWCAPTWSTYAVW